MEKEAKKEERRAEKPLVSINICTYNRSNLIEKAIESALAQDYPNIEIIIADAGSDDTEKVVEEIKKKFLDAKIYYFKSGVEGISKNRNFAFAKSRGRYIAVLDSDDFWTSPIKLSQQVKFLEENRGHTLVGTNAIIVDENNQEIGEILNDPLDKDIREKFLLKNHFVHSSVLFRKDIFIKYDETLPVWEDYELFLRFGRKSKVANLPEKMTSYKRHDGNVSSLKKIRGVHLLAKIIRQNKKYYPNYYWAEIKNFGRMLKALFLPF